MRLTQTVLSFNRTARGVLFVGLHLLVDPRLEFIQVYGRDDKFRYKLSQFGRHDAPTDQCRFTHYKSLQKVTGYERSVIVTGRRKSGKAGLR